MSEITIRRATPDDRAVILAQRHEVFVEMRFEDEAALDRANDPYADWLRYRFESGTYVGWIASDDAGEAVANAGLEVREGVLNPMWPHPNRWAYVMNLYTQPSRRRHGIARRLMETLVQWCRDDGIVAIALHPTDQSKALYAALGFHVSNEMRLTLQVESRPAH